MKSEINFFTNTFRFKQVLKAKKEMKILSLSFYELNETVYFF